VMNGGGMWRMRRRGGREGGRVGERVSQAKIID
jgi:hypothetical protein